MQYPAHWYYEKGLGLADKNIGLSFSSENVPNLTVNNGTISGTNLDPALFAPGDKIWVEGDADAFLVWVTEAETSIKYIDETGETPSMNNPTIKIIKSGRKNMPGLKAGSIAMKQINSVFEDFTEDMDCIGGAFPSNPNEVINASAVTFKDTYPVFCTEETVEHAPTVTGCTDYDSPGEYPSIISEFLHNVGYSSVVGWYNYGPDPINAVNSLVSIGCGNPPTYNVNDFIHTTASTNSSYLESHPNGESFFEFEYCACKIKLEYQPGMGIQNLWELFVENEPHPDYSYIPYWHWDFEMTGTPSIEQNLDGEWIGKFNGKFTYAPMSGYPNPSSMQNPIYAYFNVTYDAGPDCWEGICLNEIEPSEEIAIENCGPSIGETINPYQEGLKGKWRVDQTFFYDANREYGTTVDDNTGEMVVAGNGAREDGILENFVEFDWSNPNNTSDNWHDATTITKYSPFGFELEEKNSLGIYSAALYGYNHSLNTAVGANTTYNEMGFDGFEDYLLTMDNYSDPYNCNPTQSHFKFVKEEGESVSALDVCGGGTQCLSSVETHTGKYSLFLKEDEEYVSMTKDVQSVCNLPPSLELLCQSNGNTTIEECDCIGWFAPKTCETYHISAWVKEAGVSSGMSRYEAPTITIGFDGVSNEEDLNFKTEANSFIVEGWQQIKGDFEVPSGANNITISLVNNSDGAINDGVYFDDIRIHPYNSNIKTFVYHPDHLRLVAELDENNFATFYIHDEEGQLIKVKKETERGIKTIEEGRSYVRYNKYNQP